MSFDYPHFEDGSHFDSDAMITGPSRSQDWYLDPAPDGYTDQSGYQGPTLLDVSGNKFVDPHAYSSLETGKSRHPRSQSFGSMLTIILDTNVDGLYTDERTVNIPAEVARPSMGEGPTTCKHL